MKKLISVLLAVSFCLGMVVTVSAQSGSFADVKETDYFSVPVAWATENGVTVGVSDTEFGPDIPVSRAQIVTFLWREHGSPTPSGDPVFSDIPADEWFSAPVAWATETGVAEGFPDGTFDPDGVCTREQAAAFLYRYEQINGGGFDGTWYVSLDYKDADAVADWAYEAICWMDYYGVMNGYGGAVDPTGECIRAQFVTMLYRFCEGRLDLVTPEAPGFTEKVVPVYHETLDGDETATLRVYEDLPDVPYMSVTDFYNQFYLVGTDLTEGMTFTRSKDVFSLTNFGGWSATFDVRGDTVITDELFGFTCSAYYLESALSGDGYENYPFVMVEAWYDSESPVPLTLNYAEYGIDLRGDETGVYAPIETLCDLFATTNLHYVVYSGAKIYTQDDNGIFQSSSALEDDPDYPAEVSADRSEDLAEFTYRQLCFDVDLWYGKPGQEWVHDDLLTAKLDDVLTEYYPEVKEMLLSTDFDTFFSGLFHLFDGILFDGGHTCITSRLLYDKGDLARDVMDSLFDLEYGSNIYNVYTVRSEKNYMRFSVQDDLYKDDFYVEIGDTAMIRFDEFIVNYDAWKAFYSGTGERPFENDSFGTVLSGLERAASNPEIKNVVIDVSNNGGGDTYATMAIECLLTGIGVMKYNDGLIGLLVTQSARIDINFDGLFDGDETSPFTGFRYGVLTSNHSFSCANTFPWFMHEHGAMILGERSGGGVCAIRKSSSGGVEYVLSAASTRFASDSGEDMDLGCPIDADLRTDGENPYASFYDLATISALMNEFYNSEP